MNRVVEFALKQRIFILILLLATLAVGAISFWRLNIEAYPDPVPPLVDIIAQSPGLSAEEMERYVTIPIEIQMAGIPHVTAIRTISLFGLSDVKLQFTYDFTYQQAEQWVINRLSQLPPLPNGVQPQISPSSPIGEIYRYRLVAPPGYPVADLKTLQDWVLQRRFKALPGVIVVNGWGGRTKTYEVAIDQHRLAEHGLTVPQVLAAIGNANVNVGGQTVDIGPQTAVVRGIGQILNLNAGCREEFGRHPVAERDRAGLVEQQHVHITGGFNSPAACGEHVAAHQAVNAGTADGAEQAADGRRNQADDQREQDRDRGQHDANLAGGVLVVLGIRRQGDDDEDE